MNHQNNHITISFTDEQKTQLTVQPQQLNEHILDIAMSQNINLAYGCKNGGCGACKVQITTGAEYTDCPTSNALTFQEKEAGFRLLCCTTFTEDVKNKISDNIQELSPIVIDAQPLAVGLFPPKKLPSRVVSLNKVTHDIAIIHLQLPATENFQFLEGQYIDVLYKNNVRRSYSIANNTADVLESKKIELHIRHKIGGVFTEHVFNSMKEKEILRIEGPLGSFYLREAEKNNILKPIIFLASGTGFAPIKAIMEQMIAHQELQRPTVLYWGARIHQDIYAQQLIQKWCEEHSWFQFIPVISDEITTYRSGFVHQAVLDDFENLSGYEVYACGAPVMIDAAKNSFIQTRQLPKNAFFADAFI
jgi:CDP-4-dehydro-6-deoxyglucose reductase